MTENQESITVAMDIAVAQLAENLNLKLVEDPTSVFEGETAMIVTPTGISIGEIKLSYGEMRTYRYDTYSLNGETIYSNHYGITESGWEDKPTTTVSLDSTETLYTRW